MNIRFDVKLDEEQKQAKAIIIDPKRPPFTVLVGAAGTGKTLLGMQIALDLVFKGEKKKIIVTRPTVGTEDNGYLPGGIQEKMENWIVPIRDNVSKLYGASQAKQQKIRKLYDQGTLEIISLQYFRGRTFENAVCIVDEFQNLTKEQFRMCVSRLGRDSIMIFTGDKDQVDLKLKDLSAARYIKALAHSPTCNVIKLNINYRNPLINPLLDDLKYFDEE